MNTINAIQELLEDNGYNTTHFKLGNHECLQINNTYTIYFIKETIHILTYTHNTQIDLNNPQSIQDLLNTIKETLQQ